MAKWIKNDSGGSKTYLGQQIADGAYYQVTKTEDGLWANDNTLIVDIANGDAIVAKDDSGNNDITDINKGINHMKDLGVVKMQQALAEDGVTDRPYGWASFTCTKTTTTTKNLKVTESGLYMNGGLMYTENHVIGDYVCVKVVDVDNVLGYGADTVLSDYVKDWPVHPDGKTLITSNSLTTDPIPQNTYIQVKYVSIGTSTDVTAIVGINAFTVA
jgi:hypothetical protein